MGDLSVLVNCLVSWGSGKKVIRDAKTDEMLHIPDIHSKVAAFQLDCQWIGEDQTPRLAIAAEWWVLLESCHVLQ